MNVSAREKEMRKMKKTVRIVSLFLLLGMTALLFGGCGDRDHWYYDEYYVTIINDSPWDVYVQPFPLFLAPGQRADREVGYHAIHVVAIRNADGVILAEVDMVGGDVLIID
jgi:hypothetical protein